MADAEPAQVEEQQQQGDVEREAPVEQEATAAADEGQQAGAELPMSKNQMKKLRKKQFYEEKNRQRKEREKQQKQAEQDRRRAEGKERIAAMTEEEAAKWREERNARGVARKQERDAGRAKMEKALESGQRIVLDLSFADLMREGELKSICSQLGYCWHANCSAAQPAHMVLSSVEGKMKEFLTRQITGYSNWKATITPQSYLEHFTVQGVPKDKLVYLTADSDNELGELDPAAVYIIGGIVDRNRHKQLCYNKAVEEGISHARLPIGGFIQLASSPVMTTNHVVDIMLRWLELRDWKKAFEAVIPNRKRKHGEDGDGEEEEEEGKEEQEEREEPQQQQGQPAELQPKEEQAEQQPAAAAAAGGETQQ